MTALYRVEVYARGVLIATHDVEADDALSAINRVELNYGAPPQVEYKTVYHEDGARETALIVQGWHGYSFLARAVNSVAV